MYTLTFDETENDFKEQISQKEQSKFFKDMYPNTKMKYTTEFGSRQIEYVGSDEKYTAHLTFAEFFNEYLDISFECSDGNQTHISRPSSPYWKNQPCIENEYWYQE